MYSMYQILGLLACYSIVVCHAGASTPSCWCHGNYMASAIIDARNRYTYACVHILYATCVHIVYVHLERSHHTSAVNGKHLRYLFQQGCPCIELYCTVHTAHALRLPREVVVDGCLHPVALCGQSCSLSIKASLTTSQFAQSGIRAATEYTVESLPFVVQ